MPTYDEGYHFYLTGMPGLEWQHAVIEWMQASELSSKSSLILLFINYMTLGKDFIF